MSLVTDRAKREVITSLMLFVFGARSLFATRFRACRSVKIPTGVHHRVRSRRRCELRGAFQRLIAAGEFVGLPSENPASDYTGCWPGLVKRRLEQHGTGHSRDHFQ